MTLHTSHQPRPTMPKFGSGCPPFPALWTPQVWEAALKHTQDCYPQEAVGIVEEGRYVRLTNRSYTPDEEVTLDDADLLRVAGAQVFFHSHPDGPACPSHADMVYQQQLRIPFVILQWPRGDCFCFGSDLAPAPLLGRGFRHGVHDCYSLCRDWYQERRGLTLIDGPRGWNWWLKGESIYLDGFKAAGFHQIPVGEATQPGDALLFKFHAPTVMHAALVDDNSQLLIHHAAGKEAVDFTRLSARVPRARWMRHASMALRHGG